MWLKVNESNDFTVTVTVNPFGRFSVTQNDKIEKRDQKKINESNSHTIIDAMCIRKPCVFNWSCCREVDTTRIM